VGPAGLEAAETAIWRYAGPVAEAVKRAKFGGGAGADERVARALARWRPRGGLAAPEDVEAVSWVPSSPRRARRRGFELPALLARDWARDLGLPARPALVCARDDPPLSDGAGIADRASRVAGRFRARDVAGRRWLLVDDVVTTGATLREAARTLRVAGATEVRCLALAATPKE
jgi:predicted amidophosphoribosyltransferase